METRMGLRASLVGLAALGMASTATAQTFYAENPAHRTGNGGPAVMGCVNIGDRPAAWVRVQGTLSGNPAVLVVPLHLVRGRFIDFTRHNQVIGNFDAERRAILGGEIPFITGFDGMRPMMQHGYAQPLEFADEAYAITMRQMVRESRYSTEGFVSMSAVEACDGSASRPRWDGRDRSSSDQYTPRQW